MSSNLFQVHIAHHHSSKVDEYMELMDMDNQYDDIDESIQFHRQLNFLSHLGSMKPGLLPPPVVSVPNNNIVSRTASAIRRMPLTEEHEPLHSMNIHFDQQQEKSGEDGETKKPKIAVARKKEPKEPKQRKDSKQQQKDSKKPPQQPAVTTKHVHNDDNDDVRDDVHDVQPTPAAPRQQQQQQQQPQVNVVLIQPQNAKKMILDMVEESVGDQIEPNVMERMRSLSIPNVRTPSLRKAAFYYLYMSHVLEQAAMDPVLLASDMKLPRTGLNKLFKEYLPFMNTKDPVEQEFLEKRCENPLKYIVRDHMKRMHVVEQTEEILKVISDIENESEHLRARPQAVSACILWKVGVPTSRIQECLKIGINALETTYQQIRSCVLKSHEFITLLNISRTKARSTKTVMLPPTTATSTTTRTYTKRRKVVADADTVE